MDNAVLDRGDGTFEVVPEPSTWLLGATAFGAWPGCAGVGGARAGQ